MTTTTYFENITSTGNVAKFYVEVSDTPNSSAGKAHFQVGIIRRGDKDSQKVARDGKYYPTREAADARAAEMIAVFSADANLRRVCQPE